MQGRHSAIILGWMTTHGHLDGVASETETLWAGQTGACHVAVGRWILLCRHRQTGELRERHVRKWALRFAASGIDGLSDKKRPGDGVFSPVVALYVVKLACERPDVIGRSLSQWDSAELAAVGPRRRRGGHLPQTVQRILAHPS